MKLLKTLGLALCLAFLSITLSSKAQTLDPTQVYTTGNIVQTTPQGGPTPWVNGVYQNNLTCWSWGDPGYCGPNAIVRPGDSINFSYGSTYLYQQQLVSSLLPSATGLQVTGYNFGFMAKNGNGWDDGRADNLMALVRFWDNTGGRGATNLLYGDVYSLNYKFNWTAFDYSKTFTTPLAVPSIGQVQYGFIGSDNNGWAGPYGPEIYNVSFSLKYKVDPCASNVLSSPTCPGYLEALAKLVPTPVAPVVVTEVAPPPPPAIESGSVAMIGQPAPPPGSTPPPPSPGSPAPQDSSQPQQQQQAGPAPAGAPLPGPIQQASVAQPTANNPQPKVGEVNDSGSSSKTTVSLSSVLNMISSNQEKTTALEKSVVQAADAQAFSAGETAKATAEKIAGDAQAQSIAISNSQSTGSVQATVQTFSVPMQNFGITLQGNLQSNTVMNSARLEQSISNASGQQSSSSSSSYSSSQQNGLNSAKQDMGTTSLQFTLLPPPRYEPPKIENTYSSQGLQYQQSTTRQEIVAAITSPIASYNLVTPVKQTMQLVEVPTAEGIKFGYKGPLDNAMESKPFLPQTNTSSQQNDSVKKNVQDNDAAGNVTLESIAKMPTNYAQYFTAIPDAKFYEPKEIYKNQKTVDNARALRQLSSDRLHQEMINQQYK